MAGQNKITSNQKSKTTQKDKVDRCLLCDGLLSIDNTPTAMKLSACLSALGITDAALFAECDDCSEEFKVIKKLYFKKILREHPVSLGSLEEGTICHCIAIIFVV